MTEEGEGQGAQLDEKGEGQGTQWAEGQGPPRGTQQDEKQEGQGGTEGREDTAEGRGGAGERTLEKLATISWTTDFMGAT